MRSQNRSFRVSSRENPSHVMYDGSGQRALQSSVVSGREITLSEENCSTVTKFNIATIGQSSMNRQSKR